MKAALFGVFVLVIVAFAYADDGSISVYNSGGYVAVFSVQYYLNGKVVNEETDNFTLGVTKTIRIPSGATNVYLHVELYWFIGARSTIFTRTFPGPVQKCYKVWGTTLNPKYAEIDC